MYILIVFYYYLFCTYQEKNLKRTMADSTGIRANMSAQQLLDHEVSEHTMRNSIQQDGKVSTDTTRSSSLSSSNTIIDSKELAPISDSSTNSSSVEVRPAEHHLTKRQIITVLCFVNLINYMDRYTIADKHFYSFMSI